MPKFTEVHTQKDMDELLSSVAGFHDSMIKELHLVNNAHVQRDGSMIMSHSFDAHLYVQSQWAPRAIEIIFLNVCAMSSTEACEYYGATGFVGKASCLIDTPLIRLEFDNNFSIASERMLYRTREEWHGCQTRLSGEVPRPNILMAQTLGDGWRQCPACAESWEESSEIKISRCPGCFSVISLTTEYD